jgi:hypothetical protein
MPAWNREEAENKRRERVARYLRYLGLVMGVFYIGGAGFLLFVPGFGDIPSTTRYIFATLLLAYGSFRVYRSLKNV